MKEKDVNKRIDRLRKIIDRKNLLSSKIQLEITTLCNELDRWKDLKSKLKK